MSVDRRGLLIGGIAFACLPRRGDAAPSAEIAGALAALEKRAGGRLGVAVLDCRDDRMIGHRLDARFAMCSTFKLSLAACILHRIQQGRIAPDAHLPIGQADPVGHSPALRAALDQGRTQMAVIELAQAAQMVSDNGASNILLRHIGGPEALTRFWRATGDRVTRLDRYEPDLNTSHDGDPRDTTTPRAMAATMRKLLVCSMLTIDNRARLGDWMVGTQTGLKRLRAGFPQDWQAGDKTGTMTGAAYADKYNDIAICHRPGRSAPLIVTAYLEAAKDSADPEGVLEQVGSLAARWWA